MNKKISFVDVPQGTKVMASVGVGDGQAVSGTIVGKASMALPVIGATYIIEPDESIANDVYPYSHFVCPESMFTITKYPE